MENDDRNTIVVIDDSEILRRHLRDIFLKITKEQDVVTLPDGKAGLEYLIQNYNKIQLVISDIEMPKMSGHTLCAVFREAYETDLMIKYNRKKLLPIYSVTQYSSNEITKEKSLISGFTGELFKPCSELDLIQICKKNHISMNKKI